ncbi:hypothetical protein MIND_00633000 [Mycena indigotica]|uniref:Uncharacterized protein n=1 Tax=Mycena indigotica TaxID=2126181 RepID=A0A8H6SQL5_9AGAR|nr:uncharacterized protein MIND_00633000 [Mycena indigotica]KAF7304018.1 hypothetical protein MIND_00633000 [Mycena indigotica]
MPLSQTADSRNKAQPAMSTNLEFSTILPLSPTIPFADYDFCDYTRIFCQHLSTMPPAPPPTRASSPPASPAPTSPLPPTPGPSSTNTPTAPGLVDAQLSGPQNLSSSTSTAEDEEQWSVLGLEDVPMEKYNLISYNNIDDSSALAESFSDLLAMRPIAMVKGVNSPITALDYDLDLSLSLAADMDVYLQELVGSHVDCSSSGWLYHRSCAISDSRKGESDEDELAGVLGLYHDIKSTPQSSLYPDVETT